MDAQSWAGNRALSFSSVLAQLSFFQREMYAVWA